MKKRYMWTVNNYQLGALVPCTPVDKIVSRTRIDRDHTEVMYLFDNESERELTEKYLARKGTFKGFQR